MAQNEKVAERPGPAGRRMAGIRRDVMRGPRRPALLFREEERADVEAILRDSAPYLIGWIQPYAGGGAGGGGGGGKWLVVPSAARIRP